MAEMTPGVQRSHACDPADPNAGPPMHLRNFRPGDEDALHRVFFSAVHQGACRDYSPAQRDAWAPADADMAAWRQRMQALDPFVVEAGGEIIAYADLQPSVASHMK